MYKHNIPAKDIIAGPPRRACPILLRQTSFKVLSETVTFHTQNGKVQTREHKARFGEVEQRGVVLTQKEQGLYNSLINETRATTGGTPSIETAHEYYRVLEEQFKQFPDNYHQWQQGQLAFFHYSITGKKIPHGTKVFAHDVNRLIDIGYGEIKPMIYEDFLPISATGIFSSNVGNDDINRVHSDIKPSTFRTNFRATRIQFNTMIQKTISLSRAMHYAA